MKLITVRSIAIAASPAEIWAIISDIQNAAQHISAIKQIQVLSPGSERSMIGLKWRETREWMGRDAEEVMWVTSAKQDAFYETRAESHGAIYKSRLELEPQSTETMLSMYFYCQPISFMAKLMWFLTGSLAKTSLVKAIDQDLQDIKKAVEAC